MSTQLASSLAGRITTIKTMVDQGLDDNFFVVTVKRHEQNHVQGYVGMNESRICYL
jgi:hypothetical protein